MAATSILDLSRYQKVQIDNTGAPGTVYYGVSDNPTALDTSKEWALLRETVAGASVKYEWAAHKDKRPLQQYAWTDRATTTY